MGVLSKAFYKMNRIIWGITKPVTAGTRVMLIREGRILLVKHTYQNHWYLPGGGIKKGETFEEAIIREIREEIGGSMGRLQLFGVYNNFYEDKNDHIVIFLCEDFNISGEKDREIECFDFFEINALPANTSPGTKRRVQEYINVQYPSFGKW